MANWIQQDFQKPFKEKLLDSSFYESMGFDGNEIEKMLSHHILNKKDYKWPLFSLYSLSIWNDKGRRTIEKM